MMPLGYDKKDVAIEETRTLRLGDHRLGSMREGGRPHKPYKAHGAYLIDNRMLLDGDVIGGLNSGVNSLDVL